MVGGKAWSPHGGRVKAGDTGKGQHAEERELNFPMDIGVWARRADN